MLMIRSAAAAIAALVVLAMPARAQEAASPAPRSELQVHRAWRFEEDGGAVEFDNDFSGARLNACERVGACDYKVVVSPENTPINPSPWYAFRVSGTVGREIAIRIVITSSKARPWPYLSGDGKAFTRASARQYTGGEGAAECVLRLHPGQAPIWVASNHMLGVAEIAAWTDAGQPFKPGIF